MRDQGGDMPELCGVGLQELSARRDAVEQVRHADRCPHGQARRLHAHQLAAREFHTRALFFPCGASLEQQPRYRRDRGQRLTAKSQGSDREQVVGGTQFGRGVPLKSQQRVVMAHPAAVVDDPDHALAARFDFDAHRTRARVEGVLEQLFHHRSGPLDHLTGGNPVRYRFRQYANL